MSCDTIPTPTKEDLDREAFRACLESKPTLDLAVVKAEYEAQLWALIRARIKPKSKDVLRELNRARVTRADVVKMKKVVEETVRKHEARVQAWVLERHDLGKKLKARPGRLRAVVLEVNPKRLRGAKPEFERKLCEQAAETYRDLHPGVTFDAVPDGRPLRKGRWCVLASVAEELDAEIIRYGPTVELKSWIGRVKEKLGLTA